MGRPRPAPPAGGSGRAGPPADGRRCARPGWSPPRSGAARTARKLGRAQPLRQLEQRRRVSARLGHDQVPDLLVQRPGEGRVQQRPGVRLGQPVDFKLGQPGQLRTRVAGGEYQSDRVRAQTAGGEPERLGRGLIEPLLVVDQADQGTIARPPPTAGSRRQAHDEPVRRRPRDEAERGPQRVLLRQRQPLSAAEHRRAELMQPRERQLHLRLHAGRPRQLAAVFLPATWSSSVVLPTPGSPRTTRTWLSPSRTASMRPLSALSSSRRPASCAAPAPRNPCRSLFMSEPPAGEGAIQWCILHSRTWGRPPQAWGHPESGPRSASGADLQVGRGTGGRVHEPDQDVPVNHE